MQEKIEHYGLKKMCSLVHDEGHEENNQKIIFTTSVAKARKFRFPGAINPSFCIKFYNNATYLNWWWLL